MVVTGIVISRLPRLPALFVDKHSRKSRKNDAIPENQCLLLFVQDKKKPYLSPRNESPFAIFVLISEKKAAAAFTVHSGALFKGTPSERDQP